MTNQQKLQAIFDLTGKELFTQILQAVGPGMVHFPKNANSARREIRNTAIRAAFYSDEYAGKPLENVYQILANQYKLSTRQIKRIVSAPK